MRRQWERNAKSNALILFWIVQRIGGQESFSGHISFLIGKQAKDREDGVVVLRAQIHFGLLLCAGQ